MHLPPDCAALDDFDWSPLPDTTSSADTPTTRQSIAQQPKTYTHTGKRANRPRHCVKQAANGLRLRRGGRS